MLKDIAPFYLIEHREELLQSMIERTKNRIPILTFIDGKKEFTEYELSCINKDIGTMIDALTDIKYLVNLKDE